MTRYEGLGGTLSRESRSMAVNSGLEIASFGTPLASMRCDAMRCITAVCVYSCQGGVVESDERLGLPS